MFNVTLSKFIYMWGAIVILETMLFPIPAFAIDSKMQMTGASF